jgi:Cu(I)/Ag(I) efflux system membrane fusion protein
MKTKNSLIYILLLICGLVAGCKGSSGEKDESAKPQIWTCSMDPQVRQDHPGKCPICGMNLIPLKTAGAIEGTVDPDALMLSKEAAALANIQTTVVSRSNPVKEIHLYGAIQPDERLLRSLVSHVSGRIEKLSVNFTGETIRKGQIVANIYSSDLLNAQQELLEAAKLQSSQVSQMSQMSQISLLEAAREKLRLWKLTDQQIAAIEQSGTASPLTDIVAGTSGIVTAKKVEQGDYVNPGSVLFDLADLSSVWAVFDAYEVDLPYLKNGDKVEYTLQAIPGKTFSGKIAFIDPILDRTTRTAKVRVETANPGLQLKPEMYANAVVQASLKQHADEIVIPKTAVLWTGKRSIVYVKQADSDMPVFKLREIELGPSLGDAYVVISGISDGEEIVTNGAFSIDASAQLEGKRSMMNP